MVGKGRPEGPPRTRRVGGRAARVKRGRRASRGTLRARRGRNAPGPVARDRLQIAARQIREEFAQVRSQGPAAKGLAGPAVAVVVDAEDGLPVQILDRDGGHPDTMRLVIDGAVEALDMCVLLRGVRMDHLLADTALAQELLEHPPILRTIVGLDVGDRGRDFLKHLRQHLPCSGRKEEVIREAAYLVTGS